MRSTAESTKTGTMPTEAPVKASKAKKTHGNSDTVTRQTIVARIADKTNVSTKEATELFDEVLQILQDALAKNDDVLISGFGKFVTLKKGARTGRNPRTNEPVEIPARKVLKFRPADKLKQVLSQPPTK